MGTRKQTSKRTKATRSPPPRGTGAARMTAAKKTARTKKHTEKKTAKKTAAAKKKSASTKERTTQRPQSDHRHEHTTASGRDTFFAQMGGPFLGMLHAAADAPAADPFRMTQDWLEAQRQHWQSVSAGQHKTATAHDFWQAFGQQTFAQHMPYGGAGFFGSTGPDSPFAFGARAFDPLDQLASLPGIGYLREKHEEFSRLYKAWQAHETAQQKYTAALAHMMLDALARFETSIAAPREGQKPFASLKDIYAHWVAINESAYAQFAASGTHTALYGELVNTLSAVRREMTVIVDQWAAQMNLPTRAEVDSLHQRMHEMKRELRALKTAAQAGKRRRT